MLVLNLPEEAKVFVNGYRTTSVGSRRQLRSSGLKPGKNYTYEVRTVVGSRAVTKFATLKAGDKVEMDFDFNKSGSEETVLTLNVPENATVNLAGSEMKQTGTRRVYSTSRLSDGKTWSDYVIKVTVEKDGQTLTKERTMTIRGGESYELNFDFEPTLVVSR